jgi:transcriptional regulator with XRE-family HTH domain
VRFSERFERFLQLYRKADGSQWTPAEIQRATNGFVNLSYISSLRTDRIRNPGTDKLRAMAEVMGFPWELWYEDPGKWDAVIQREEGEERSLAELLNHLFDVVENFRTHKPYTSEEVADLSRGKLRRADVEAMRSGELENPTMDQLLALSDVFGVDPAYWFSGFPERSPLDPKVIEALRDPEVELILQKTLGISKEDRGMILGLIERLARGEGE